MPQTQSLASGKLGKAMLTLLVISVLLVVTCAPVAERGDVTARELAEMLRKDTSIILVDVRTPEEYQQGHIKAARLMDFYSAEFHAQLQTLPKEKSIVLYCRSGRRSAEAAKFLASIGYSRVLNMLGGIIQWKKDRQPLVGP